MILHGDCLEKLKELADNSIDSVITDPPYGLKFMGKRWDHTVPSVDVWREVLRVLKPGGHLLSFGGTRTYHRMVVAIEDAGFEVRDQIQWIYGSGFPKSHSIDKAIDKMHGAEREIVGTYKIPGHGRDNVAQGAQNRTKFEFDKTSNEPATPDAIKWQGWGTALKPANEPIVLARKPLDASCTIAENVLKHGVGGLNIDASRIEGIKASGSQADFKAMRKDTKGFGYHGDSIKTKLFNDTSQGRWPANVIFDECAAILLDEQSGHLPARGQYKASLKKPKTEGESLFGNTVSARNNEQSYGDTGGASRFFYCAKSSKRERNHGCEGMALKPGGSNAKGYTADVARGLDRNRPVANHHPTVKPIKLMEYLIKLITPHGGTVLDPFAGSGSTLVAAKRLGFNFIGIEMNEDYVSIAEKRIEAAL